MMELPMDPLKLETLVLGISRFAAFMDRYVELEVGLAASLFCTSGRLVPSCCCLILERILTILRCFFIMWSHQRSRRGV